MEPNFVCKVSKVQVDPLTSQKRLQWHTFQQTERAIHVAALI